MLEELVFKIKIDSEARWYNPFTLLTIFLCFGIISFFLMLSPTYINLSFLDYYWHVFFAVLLLEIIAIQFVFPNERIELKMIPGVGLTFYYIKDNKPNIIKNIKEVSYWWNYNFGGNNRDEEYSSSSGSNGGLRPGSTANGLYLYIKLTDEYGDEILLFETEGNWASTPHWPYKLDTARDFEHQYDCFYLKEVVKNFNFDKGIHKFSPMDLKSAHPVTSTVA